MEAKHIRYIEQFIAGGIPRPSLSDEGKKALDVKNRMNPNITVKTYDDIVDRAQQYLDNILKLFIGP